MSISDESARAYPDMHSEPGDSGTEPAIEVGLGRRVRELRQSRGLSVAGLAERAGMSKAMLSKIENAQTSCSLTSVAALAGALDVSVPTLFRDVCADRPSAYTPAGKGTRVDGRGTRHGHLYELLGSFRGRGDGSAAPHLEPVLVTLRNDSDSYPRFQHPGTELLYVLEGRMTYRFQDTDDPMGPGDSLMFDGQGTHGPVDLIELPIRFLAVTAYPQEEA